jgi:hypothetical protein
MCGRSRRTTRYGRRTTSTSLDTRRAGSSVCCPVTPIGELQSFPLQKVNCWHLPYNAPHCYSCLRLYSPSRREPLCLLREHYRTVCTRHLLSTNNLPTRFVNLTIFLGGGGGEIKITSKRKHHHDNQLPVVWILPLLILPEGVFVSFSHRMRPSVRS